MSLWPKNRCTDFRSIPFCSIRVAAVARNLWSHQLAGSTPARLAIALQQSRKFNFGLHPAVGNTKPQVLSDFSFHAFIRQESGKLQQVFALDVFEVELGTRLSEVR